MLIEVINLSKHLGAKTLFEELSFFVDKGEKVALIGRNGQGKTTLLKILAGEDKDFTGVINKKRNLNVTLTRQEHMVGKDLTVLDYILQSVPDFYKHEKILHDFEAGKITNINQYSDSLEYFTKHGYYYIKDLIAGALIDFQIPRDSINKPLLNLSGGQKRYVEMVRMMYSRADLLLVDEPTNHMDYVGKNRFIAWMKSVESSVLVVTHDRDVLKNVSKIFELKDKKLYLYKGNYDQYISLNSQNTLSSVKDYESQLNRLKEAKKRVDWGLQMRAKSKQWKIRYDHWLRDYEKIKAETVKPSFWIDKDSVENIDQKVLDSYQKFKEKNISIAVKQFKIQSTELINVRNLALGYQDPVFLDVNFTIKNNDRVFIKGRNGAGKSTLVRTILALSKNQKPKAEIFDGEIILGNDLRIGEYEQEIDHKYLDMPLAEAVWSSYVEKGQTVDQSQVRSLLARYLFDPVNDAQQRIRHLSGGQKARFQLIKMFIDQPNLLILDEPTNHLDLPSIEELENTLNSFQGGIIYISHDNYFIERLGGQVVEI